MNHDKTLTSQKTGKPDYSLQSRRSKSIGDRGEQIVFQAEIEKLIKCNRKDLAEKINHVAK